jgi:hypothetical protein
VELEDQNVPLPSRGLAKLNALLKFNMPHTGAVLAEKAREDRRSRRRSRLLTTPPLPQRDNLQLTPPLPPLPLVSLPELESLTPQKIRREREAQFNKNLLAQAASEDAGERMRRASSVSLEHVRKWASRWKKSGLLHTLPLPVRLLQDDPQLTDLNRSLVSAAELKQAAVALAHNTALRRLCLTKSEISGGAGEAFAKSIQTNKGIQTLTLNESQLNQSASSLLAHALVANHTITALDLARNNLTDEHAKHFARVLDVPVTRAWGQAAKHNRTLTSLTLDSNKIANEGIAAISVRRVTTVLFCFVVVKLCFLFFFTATTW